MIPRKLPNEIPSYSASKWITLPLFVTPEEFKSALGLLPDLITPLGGIIKDGQERIPKEVFFKAYENFYTEIRDQQNPRPIPSKLLTACFYSREDALFASETTSGLIVRVVRPVIQVKPYYLNYSETLGKFTDASYSEESFAFGVVFFIPQLYQDFLTKEVEKVVIDEFNLLRKWARENTQPATFLVDSKQVNIPARVSRSEVLPLCIPPKF